MANQKTARKGNRRAIVVYVEDKPALIKQILNLYKSIKHVGFDKGDTDFVIFCDEASSKKIPDDCIKIIKPPLKEPPFNRYPRMNSIACFGDPILRDYDFLIKSDIDTFILPGFNSFFPEKLTCRKWVHANRQEVKDNLRKVAGVFGIKYKDIENIGSTIHGPSEEIVKIFTSAVDIAKHLLEVEFKNSEGKWPGWYRGVSLMYATEIAINNISDGVNYTDQFDISSASKESVSDFSLAHCLHTNEIFSKFKFNDGKYRGMDTSELDKTKINNYCLDLALKKVADV